MKQVKVPIKLKKGAKPPIYGSEEAAGSDIFAFLDQEVIISPGKRTLIPTGVYLEISKGYEIQVRPRSGLALKQGITLVNTPGTIDSDYRGEIGIILINHGEDDFIVTPNMRIAQLVLSPVYQALYREEEVLKTTERGEGSFGHTGTH